MSKDLTVSERDELEFLRKFLLENFEITNLRYFTWMSDSVLFFLHASDDGCQSVMDNGEPEKLLEIFRRAYLEKHGEAPEEPSRTKQ